MDFKEAGDDPRHPPGPPDKGFPIKSRFWVVPTCWILLFLATCLWIWLVRSP
jgi:hypothetical protein